MTNLIKLKLILTTACIAFFSVNATASFLGHVAAYSTGAVIAHESEKYIDHKLNDKQTSNIPSKNNGNFYPIENGMPNKKLTPGAINPDVTQNNIQETICKKGYTKTIRPDENYTHNLKIKSIAEYGYEDRHLSNYEFDHLVSLEVGGAPSDPKNLWPEPHNVQGGWGSYTKDALENRLNQLICNGTITLARAQFEEANDWIAAYKKYVSPTPLNQ
jgi:hypothetical protein